MAKIHEIRHPVYRAKEDIWYRYRLTGESGEEYLDEYLKKRPKETTQEFNDRRDISYIPAFAKKALLNVNDKIQQRLFSVSRVGGSDNYRKAIIGLDKGVDRARSSMNKFIADEVLPELTMMGGVGVYCDAPIKQGDTLQDDLSHIPYLYTYRVENILSWAVDPRDPMRFVKLLLRDEIDSLDEDYGLATDTVYRYRYYSVDENGQVTLQFFNENGDQTNAESELAQDVYALSIDEIPFIYLKLNNSLLCDIARYQSALLNLGSSDMKYAYSGNVSFLAEKYDPNDPENYFGAQNADEESSEQGEAATVAIKQRRLELGTDRAMRVPKDLEYPSYISPDSGPLEVSMAKQEKLQEQIEELMAQTIENAKSSSTPLPTSGLKAIGDELEYAENIMAHYWSMYEGSENPAVITYPDSYELKTEKDRLEEADKVLDLAERTTGNTSKKALAKEVIRILLSGKVSEDELIRCYGEVDDAKCIIANPEKIQKLIDANVLSTETGAELIGLSPEEAVKAENARVRRAERIALAQLESKNPGARGIDDLSVNPREEAREEKLQIRDDATDRTAVK